MISRDDWLPVGTVVAIEGAARPVMIAGVMALDGKTGRYWDYIGVPYPEGRGAAVEGVLAIGYQDEQFASLVDRLDALASGAGPRGQATGEGEAA